MRWDEMRERWQLGKGALKIDSKQNLSNLGHNSSNTTTSYLEENNTPRSKLFSGAFFQNERRHPSLGTPEKYYILRVVAPGFHESVYAYGSPSLSVGTIKNNFFREIAIAELDNNLSDNSPFTIASSFF
jgi:hypothetical protein